MSIQQVILSTTAFVLLIVQVRALSVFPGSPCYNTCDGSSATSSDDIVCTDSDFANTQAGQTLSSCVTCLHQSNYQNGFKTDSTLFLYYLSIIQQTCLGDSDATSSCSTCSNIASSFSNLGGRNQFQDPYAYCSANNNVYSNSASQCSTCLQSNSSVVLGNVVYVGELGCETTPAIQDGDAIAYSGNLFGTMALGTTSSKTRTSSAGSSSKPTSISSSSRTSNTTVTVSTLIPGSVTVVSTATVALTPSSTSSTNAISEKATASAPLSRGAAAGIGLVLGIFGIAGIIALAIMLRRRQMRKDAANFKRMPSPTMVQRSATPPAAGVFLAPGHKSSTASAAAAAVGAFARAGLGKSTAKDPEAAPPPKDIERNEGLPKHSKSFRSMTSKSWRSKNVTPRTSAWFYAANPKTSSDLTALPQPTIVPGMGGTPEVPSSRGTHGATGTPRTPRTTGRGWE